MGSHIYFQRRSPERGDGSELIISNATSPGRGMYANYYFFLSKPLGMKVGVMGTPSPLFFPARFGAFPHPLYHPGVVQGVRKRAETRRKKKGARGPHDPHLHPQGFGQEEIIISIHPPAWGSGIGNN